MNVGDVVYMCEDEAARLPGWRRRRHAGHEPDPKNRPYVVFSVDDRTFALLALTKNPDTCAGVGCIEIPNSARRGAWPDGFLAIRDVRRAVALQRESPAAALARKPSRSKAIDVAALRCLPSRLCTFRVPWAATALWDSIHD